MITEKYEIQAEDEILSCEVDYYDEKKIQPSVICLHGGGSSSKKSTEYLTPVFLEKNKSVIRFDFSGQGESSGEIKKSSLEKRNKEVKAILKYFNICENLTVIGSSMGGYIASTLVKDFDIENLILFCPAAYSQDAWSVRFDLGFTDIIRTEKSYLNSDIEDILSNYKGKSLFFIGSEDDIIPNEVVNLFDISLKNTIYSEKYILKNCPHPIHRWGIKNSHAQDFINLTHKKMRKKESYELGIELEETKEIIGMVGLIHVDYKNKNAEVGYWLGKKYWKQGLTTESLKLMLKFGFRELKLKRLYAKVMSPNTSSANLLKKNDFKLEGKLRKNTLKNGKLMDDLIYGLLKEEWKC